jgi:predicted nucleic acid-binding protein
MKRGVLWDSSAVLALLDGTDACHAAAGVIAERLSADARPSVITNYLEVETHALLLNRLGRGTAREWLFRRPLPLIRALPADEQRAREILARYVDKDFSLCDAISFAVMERLGMRTVFSFDRHFLQYGRFEVLGA